MSNAPALPHLDDNASPHGLGASKLSFHSSDAPHSSEIPPEPVPVSGGSATTDCSLILPPSAPVAQTEASAITPGINAGASPLNPWIVRPELAPPQESNRPSPRFVGMRDAQGNFIEPKRSLLPVNRGKSSDPRPAKIGLASPLNQAGDSHSNTTLPHDLRAPSPTVALPTDTACTGPDTSSARRKSRQTTINSKLLSADTIYWDPDHRGLGRRVRNGSSVTWIIQFRSGSHTVRRKLGDVEECSREQAWVEAQTLRQTITSAPNELKGPKGVTLRDFSERFLRERRQSWKQSTVATNIKQVRKMVAGPIGERLVTELNRAVVTAWRASRHGQCNRFLSLMSQMCGHAEDVGLRPRGSNPCRGLARKKTAFTAHYPRPDDYAAIGVSMRALEAEQPAAIALLRFLALTGARRSQALNLKRCHVNGDRVIQPDSKAGPCTIFLPPQVLPVIARQRRGHPNGYVFAGGSRSSLDKKLSATWNRIRNPLGLHSMRIHDLRHGFASVGVGNGEELRVVGCLLGHKDSNTTAGYAHLAERPVAEAAQRVSARISMSLDAALGPRRTISNGVGRRPS